MTNQGTGMPQKEKDDSSMGNQNKRGAQDSSENSSTNSGRVDTDWQ